MIDPAGIFTAAEFAFEAALAKDCQEVRYRIANHVIALKFSGSALAAKLLPAFAHLEPAGDMPADFVICSWDDASTEVNAMDWMPEVGRCGIGYVDGPIRLAWDLEDRSLQAYDPARRVALFRIPDVARLAAWEQGAPFRRILHWWSAGQGVQLVHGAAVGNTAGCVLLAGRGGSGKSTTALACVGSALGYLADDYCLLEPGEPPYVHSVYGSGKADALAIARLPHLADAFRASLIDQQGKSIIFIAQHAPSAVLRCLPLRAIVVPRIEPGPASRLRVLPRGEALRALAPSTLFQMPGDRAASLTRMIALIRDLPCFGLDIGNDPATAQPLLEAIIAGRA